MSTGIMTADALLDGFQELDARTNDGVDVALYWSPKHETLRLRVEDWKLGSPVRIVTVTPRDAADAFRHPFRYLR